MTIRISDVEKAYVASNDFVSGVWTTYELTKEGSTNIYSETLSLSPAKSIKYKYGFKPSTSEDITYENPNDASRKHLFIYPYNGTDTSIMVKGDFNSWSGWDLTKDTDGYWRTTQEVSNGSYEYKYVINV